MEKPRDWKKTEFKWNDENEIGTEWGDEKYAGPLHGWVSNEKYNELLKDDKLGRGEQATRYIAGTIGQHIGDTYKQIGEYIPDINLPTPSDKIKNAVNIAGQISGKIYDWTIKENVEHVMAVADAPVSATVWASKQLDPTGRGFSRTPVEIAETVIPLTGGPIKKALKYSDNILDAVRVSKQLNPALVTVGDGIIPKITKTATDSPFTPPTVFAATTGSTSAAKRTILGKKYTDEVDRRFNRVEHMETQTINTFKKKAGTQYDSLVEKLNKSYEHYEKHGNLKGMEGGTKWTNEDTGEIFMIKNKAAKAERVKLGVDSLESVAATKALREASAKITLDDVVKIAKETGIDEATAVKYFNEASKGKKDLMKLIHSLNKEAGEKLWSLGHGRAVKALRDSGSAHADMLSNIELEPLMNVVDEFGNVIVRGNSGRGAVDELPDALNTALNRSRTLREELLKFKDKDLGEFWPKMGPITDEASFLTESAKRDAFIEKVLEVNKETKDIKVAIDEVLTASGMMQEGIRQPSTFLDASIYKNLKIDLN